MLVRGGESPAYLLWSQSGKKRHERTPMPSNQTISVHHLIEDAGERSVARYERFDTRDVLRPPPVSLGAHAAIAPGADA